MRRTLNVAAYCGRTPAELERRMRGARRWPGWETLPAEQLMATMRREDHAIIGSPDEVVAQLRAYGEAGIAEVSVQWYDAEDLEGLELLANSVLPRLGPTTA